VAIARAYINKPTLVLADEPTGNLDRKTAASVAELVFELQRVEGAAMVAVTHSQELAARFARRAELTDGKLCGG
jgi:predicted ABC-type transport system involved in lysophospholipase L1 biosynthesis ATPase subunit